jgi:hypothetical protein
VDENLNPDGRASESFPRQRRCSAEGALP